MIYTVFLCCKSAYRQTRLWRSPVSVQVVLSPRWNESARPVWKEASDEREKKGSW